MREHHADVLVAGGSLGGVAAALAAGHRGARVFLIAEGAWIGGQLTSQGVCTPDENAWIETSGAPASYLKLRAAIREHYRTRHRLSDLGQAREPLNPGGCWVSRISVEPRVALALLEDAVRSSRAVTILRGCRPVACEFQGDRVLSVMFHGPDGATIRVRAGMFLDATDQGDLLPLCDCEHVLGAESRWETGEPDAPPEARPDWIQPCTVPFALELRPSGESHVIPKPPGYERMKAVQRYHVLDGAMEGMFISPGWWDYRRVIQASLFDDPAFPYDVSMINTGSNDYRGGIVPGGTQAETEHALREARLASLGYLYWLQTECPREDDPQRAGYPELRLRSDWFESKDGLAMEPYIRESRRIHALETVREQDIVVRDGAGTPWQKGTRARTRWNSVGIGHYWLDVHEGASDEPGRFLETRPYQIPLGALIPRRLVNLLPACKNLGVTHLTNGAFRLHPVEWAIGEAAGTLAAFCLERGVTPAEVWDREGLTHALQWRLLEGGAPLYWWGDLEPGSRVWLAAQWLALRGVWPEEETMDFRPQEPVAADFPIRRPGCSTRGELAIRLMEEQTLPV